MRKFYHKIFQGIFFIALLFGLSSCDTRRELLEESKVWVRVSLDWEQAGISPEGASVWFFPQTQGGKPKVLLTNNTLDSISLPIGSYSVLVFNETINGHDYIAFRGTDSYNSFEAFAKPVTINGKYTRDGGEEIVASTPGILAAAHLDQFDITPEMSLPGQVSILEFSPKRLISTVSLTVHIKGMNNAASGGHAASLSGMASSVFLATETTSADPTVHYFTLNNRAFYPNSGDDGTMSATFYAFGLTNMLLTRAAETRNLLSLYFLLLDGSDHILTDIDVTDKIEIVEATTGLILYIELGQKGSPFITLPDVLDFGSSGFDVDVDQWGEQVTIDVPI